MSKPKVIADLHIPFLRGVLEDCAEIEYLPSEQITREKVRFADALLIRTRTKCNHELLTGSNVRFIATATIGYDHIDTKFCSGNGISWVNAPGCNSGSVLQYVLAAMSLLILEKGFTPKGATLGVVGAGHIGQKVERAARLMGMRVMLNDPPREVAEGSSDFRDLKSVLSSSDIISLHVPLNVSGPYKSLHLLNAQTLSWIKPGCILINTSRGEVIDTEALKHSMQQGLLGEVVLDVWEHEPAPDKELLQNAFISTPHIAGYSADGKANATQQIVRSLSNFFQFPLDNREFPSLPPPSDPVINLVTKGRSTDETLAEAILKTCQLREDDNLLRNTPGLFEQLRKNYRYRREFHAFELRLSGSDLQTDQLFRNLGFRLHSG